MTVPPRIAGADRSPPPANTATDPAEISAQRLLLTPSEIARVVDRIAHQILERTADSSSPPILLGIPTRGSVLAVRLAQRLEVFSGAPPICGSLDITLYRDDLRHKAPRALEETSMPVGGIEAATVILVDDVLFSGRTVRAALDALREYGRPSVVQLAVLVDRGHRQLPIRADYVGKNIPTAAGDSVDVRFTETDGYDAVELKRAP
ncbi:bifunctional pyr operon transcriptional regulator/uracil phosphoribosyltransferase PyrR [Nakamurella antarctica]|uniref:Bifunctional protein PyrR n=1 Tax=Nakamurella antarctica TaxID=1902245 RepID=A0A3G8ZL02_9ACTN|nr:bifunctional pyr operon transcriptional regulator/uracil phosphoribosyltransferase PyrR [Nakamurella antarctica]AZI57467.1 bifunctional pyr operon transcriptional regulator/uracil phosphoribosyltransferase PyrR [Nakamurella antarctica]